MTQAFLVVVAFVLGATGMATKANATEIRVLSATPLKLAMDQILPEFQMSSDHTVAISYGTAGVVTDRVRKGELADVAITSTPQLEMLENQGLVVQGSRTNIAGIGLGVAIRKGASKPDISSVERFKGALLSAGSIGYIDPGIGSLSGIYVAGRLERLGITEDLKSKIKLVGVSGDIEGTYQAVVKGDIDIQIGQITEIVTVPGVDLVGPLPPEIQNISWMAAGIVAASKTSEAASTFIKFISSPAAAVLFKARGYEAR